MNTVKIYVYLGYIEQTQPMNKKTEEKRTVMVLLEDLMNSSLPLQEEKGLVWSKNPSRTNTGSVYRHFTKEQERKPRTAQRGMEEKILGVAQR